LLKTLRQRDELLFRLLRTNGGEMIVCPICNGTGVTISERQPQGVAKERTCPACLGVGEVEEVKTKRPIITIYKYHGGYQSESNAQPY